MKKFLLRGTLFIFSAISSICATADTGFFSQYVRSTSAANGAQEKMRSINTDSRSARPLFSAPFKAEQEAINVPFTHSLGKNESDITNTYTVIDANHDERTWKPGGFTAYSVCMKPTTEISMDDWLISPPINLSANAEYTISLDLRQVLTPSHNDKLSVWIGNSPTVEGMTQSLKEIEIAGKDWSTTEFTFTSGEAGVYYIGFHAETEANCSANIGICNFGMTNEVPESVDPPAAGTLTYQVFPKGELKAHVVYTAPTLTVSGATLTKIDKVEIINRWYEKFEYTDVNPGQTIELDVELFSGMSNNRLQATAYVLNSNGDYIAGEEVLVTGIMAGYDYPLAPENILAEVSADGKTVTLTWNPVGEVGESGGYVDAENITYYIFDAFGSYYDPAIAYTTATRYVFDYSDKTEQDFMAYQVTAAYEKNGNEYASLNGTSNVITYGPALSLPFTESFANCRFKNIWMTDPETNMFKYGTVEDNYLQTNGDDPTAEPTFLNSQDNDNGFFYMLPMEKDEVCGLISLSIDLKGATNPILEFYAQGKGSVLDVLAGKSISNLSVVRSIDFKQTPTNDWTKYSVSLKDFISVGSINIELRLRAIHNDDEHTWSVPIDNIRVRDALENNLAVSFYNTPAEIKVGETTPIIVKVENLGQNDAANAKLVLTRNGELAKEWQISTVHSGESQLFEYPEKADIMDSDEIEYFAELIYADDAPMDNKCTSIVSVIFPSHPAVSTLSGNVNEGVVSLNWQPISLDGLTEPIETFEDFENPEYEALTIEDFGDWTMIDLDGYKTYSFLNDKNNPHRTEPMAYQLYNPALAGVPESYLPDCPTHSGSQMLVAWSCPYNNYNLLISPKLSGEKQTVTFYARSFTTAYPETFTVYTSTTGKEIDDFTRFNNVQGNFYNSYYIPEDWTQYKLELPEGTLYFAILHDSYDTYALFLDDFSFEKASVLPSDTQLMGYNVYRNRMKITETPVDGTEYADIPTKEDGHHSYEYQVTAVYNNAESRPSEPLKINYELSGIDDVNVDSTTTEYYGIDGRRLKEANRTPGIYIRVNGNKAEKVTVR